MITMSIQGLQRASLHELALTPVQPVLVLGSVLSCTALGELYQVFQTNLPRILYYVFCVCRVVVEKFIVPCHCLFQHTKRDAISCKMEETSCRDFTTEHIGILINKREVVHKLANNILKPANNIINFSKIALRLSEFLMTFKYLIFN